MQCLLYYKRLLSRSLTKRLLETLFIFVYSLLIVTFSDLDGLYMGLKFPNMEWTNETAVVKQGMAPFVALFGNWIVVVVIAGLYFLLRKSISAYVYAGIISILLLICILCLRAWIFKKGAEIFRHL